MSLTRLGSAVTRRHIETQNMQAATHAKKLQGDLPAPTSPAPQNTTIPETNTATEKAFEQLVQYFPTETMTLFLAAVSLVQTLEHVPWVAALRPFGLIAIFTVLTPLMLLLVAFATFREAQRAGTIPKENSFQLPIFELCASAVAFLPWAFAVPGVFAKAKDLPAEQIAQGVWTAEIAQVFAAFAAFAVSWFLAQLRRIFQPI